MSVSLLKEAVMIVVQNRAWKETNGEVHCPICTRTVEAVVLVSGKSAKVKPGQRCPRCHSSLDAAWVVMQAKAA